MRYMYIFVNFFLSYHTSQENQLFVLMRLTWLNKVCMHVFMYECTCIPCCEKNRSGISFFK